MDRGNPDQGGGFGLHGGLAARGAVGGDVFVVSAIGFVVAMVGVFIFMPAISSVMKITWATWISK